MNPTEPQTNVTEDKKNFKKDADKDYIKSVSDVDCACEAQEKLDAALAQQNANPEIFAPENAPVKDAYCSTHGRKCDD